MNKKYPVLKCTNELWKEIKPILESFGITNFTNIGNGKNSCFHLYPFLVSNYGHGYNDIFLIGNADEPRIDGHDSLRYLVNTKEEFLSEVAKLLNKEYKMERNIKVTLKKAKEWYNSNNNTLKELALQAFEEKELNSFENILLCVAYNNISYKTSFTQRDKWSALHKLSIIAEFLNDGWQPDWTNNSEAKYYIFKDFQLKEIQIAITHSCNNGCIYFKTKELAEVAIEILGKEIENIFD